MKRIIILFIIVCCYPSLVTAGGASCIQDLANQVKLLVSTGNVEKISELIHPDVEEPSVTRFKEMLASYKGAGEFKVYAVPKDDQAKVKSLKESDPIPGTFLTVDERVKKYRDAGRTFKVAPLGDLVITGKRLGVNSKGSITSVLYGISNGRYVITFARRR